MQNIRIIAGLWILLAMLAGCGADRAYTLEELQGAEAGIAEEERKNAPEEEEQKPQQSVNAADSGEEALTQTIFVHVCGEVQAPGVYELPAGSRAARALDAAGGWTPEADETYVNLAQALSDGQKLYFPSKEETAGSGFDPAGEDTQNGGAQTAGDGKVHLNSATAEQLQMLPGIGETRAREILAYREAHGGFSSKEELKEVSGIGEASYQKLEDLIAVP